jgi:DNA-damage-inducible protein J
VALASTIRKGVIMHISNTYKDSMVKARVNSTLKNQAEEVLKELGISMSETINALLSQIKLTRSVPFQLKIPNAETRRVFEETDAGIGVVECKDVADLFNQLELNNAKTKVQKRFSKRSQISRKKR